MDRESAFWGTVLDGATAVADRFYEAANGAARGSEIYCVLRRVGSLQTLVGDLLNEGVRHDEVTVLTRTGRHHPPPEPRPGGVRSSAAFGAAVGAVAGLLATGLPVLAVSLVPAAMDGGVAALVLCGGAVYGGSLGAVIAGLRALHRSVAAPASGVPAVPSDVVVVVRARSARASQAVKAVRRVVQAYGATYVAIADTGEDGRLGLRTDLRALADGLPGGVRERTS